jgi:DNA polymerase-3 subunit gamma/tau
MTVSGPQESRAPSTPATEKPAAPLTTETPRLRGLDKIRQQFKNNGEVTQRNENILDTDKLTKAWMQYADQLRQQRNPAVQPFEAARLQISDANCFVVMTSNNIEQKFIEQERNSLFQFLQQQLQVSGLQFTVLVEEQTGQQPPAEGMLSSKEQFQELIKQYPQVQELKERLRLELDY